MKLIGLFSLTFAMLSLIACGSTSNDPQIRADEVIWRNGQPAAVVHRGAPPKKLIVKDLRVGSGTVLGKGDLASLRYKSFDYRTGGRYEDWWAKPFRTGFGKDESLGAWETGLRGMRVGGRRELVVPAKEAYGHAPVVYVLELISVRRTS